MCLKRHGKYECQIFLTFVRAEMELVLYVKWPLTVRDRNDNSMCHDSPVPVMFVRSDLFLRRFETSTNVTLLVSYFCFSAIMP